MTLAEIRNRLTDKQALMATLYGEARGESLSAMRGVACCIRNRVQLDLGNDGKPDWWGEGYKGVCLAKWQFSCWWELQSKNTEATYAFAERLLSGAATVDETRVFDVAATKVMEGAADLTMGATHYVTKALLAVAPPDWAHNRFPCAIIGSHVFFNLSKG